MLVWIDLEMTGLNSALDTILEIATIITDNQLNVVATGPHLIIGHTQEQLDNMDPWCINTHGKSGLSALALQSKITVHEAERQTLEFIKMYCPLHKAYLAGNTVWQDRIFLHKYMPSIVHYLHYRLVDVTTVKNMVNMWYASWPEREFKKTDGHRALSDIRQSIAELEHYRAVFFKKPERLFVEPF
ncbi:oligoribonuclease [Vermiphilus pyriformis]|nr:MAG: oligoribonuclease [Vermiphilus pyriformis]